MRFYITFVVGRCKKSLRRKLHRSTLAHLTQLLKCTPTGLSSTTVKHTACTPATASCSTMKVPDVGSTSSHAKSPEVLPKSVWDCKVSWHPCTLSVLLQIWVVCLMIVFVSTNFCCSLSVSSINFDWILFRYRLHHFGKHRFQKRLGTRQRLRWGHVDDAPAWHVSSVSNNKLFFTCIKYNIFDAHWNLGLSVVSFRVLFPVSLLIVV